MRRSAFSKVLINLLNCGLTKYRHMLPRLGYQVLSTPVNLLSLNRQVKFIVHIIPSNILSSYHQASIHQQINLTS